jgi:hypothetical protein
MPGLIELFIFRAHLITKRRTPESDWPSGIHQRRHSHAIAIVPR